MEDTPNPIHFSFFHSSSFSNQSISGCFSVLLLLSRMPRKHAVIGLRSLRLTPTLGVMMVFRFVISPALGAALCALLGIGGLVRSVYVVELAMPVVTQTVVAAAEYGADEQLAAQGAAISTLACFVVTPVLMLLL